MQVVFFSLRLEEIQCDKCKCVVKFLRGGNGGTSFFLFTTFIIDKSQQNTIVGLFEAIALLLYIYDSTAYKFYYYMNRYLFMHLKLPFLSV